MGGLALEGGCPLCFLTQGHVKKSMVWWPCFFAETRNVWGSSLTGGPFQKHRSTIVFVGKGLGTP